MILASIAVCAVYDVCLLEILITRAPLRHVHEGFHACILNVITHRMCRSVADIFIDESSSSLLSSGPFIGNEGALLERYQASPHACANSVPAKSSAGNLLHHPGAAQEPKKRSRMMSPKNPSRNLDSVACHSELQVSTRW